MPRRSQQQFAFGRQEGTYDQLDDDSDCSSLTDEYDSGDSDSLDFGSVTFEGDDKGAEDGDAAAKEVEDNEWDEDEYPPLNIDEEALKHVASQYLPGNHGNCIDVTTLPRGSFHEIRLLNFEDGWTCIGRFTRDPEEPLAVLESAVATSEYVRTHSKIPVPTTYFVNPNPNHAVGAAFTLSEWIEGQHLYKIWDDLSLQHKKDVMKQIADIMLQMAELKFDSIGLLNSDGSVGALHDGPTADHAFHAILEYLLGDLPDPTLCTEEIRSLNDEFKSYLFFALENYKETAALSAPYRLIHTDFDAQNMLFATSDLSQPPQLIGIIDWDNSHTGLLYELMEYPIFIQDVDWSPELFATNKILRKRLLRCLENGYDKGLKHSKDVKRCFRMKEWVLSNFRDMWVQPEDGQEGIDRARVQLEQLKNGTALPYDGTPEWERDSEAESEDEEDT